VEVNTAGKEQKQIPIIVQPELIELVIWGAALSKKAGWRDIALIASKLLDLKLQLIKEQGGQHDRKYDALFNISDISENDVELVRVAMQLHGNNIIEFYPENKEILRLRFKALSSHKISMFQKKNLSWHGRVPGPLYWILTRC